MPVSFVDCEVDAALEEAVLRGLEAVGLEDAEVRICGNFAREVAEFTGRDYAVERPGGFAGGRTLEPKDGGEPVIFLDAKSLDDPEVREGRTLAETVERLAAHEAGHVAMIRAQEDVSEAEIQALRFVPGLLRQLTGIAVAEHRAERAVREAGYWDASLSDDRLISLAIETYRVLTDEECGDPAVLARRTAPICQSYVVSIANAAAWDQELGPAELRPLFVEGNSSRLYAELQALPPANVPMGAEEFQAALDGLTPLVVGALLDLGFEWVDHPGGDWGFYRRTTEARVTRRLEIAADWLNEQQGDG